jgi:hypothetical protein
MAGCSPPAARRPLLGFRWGRGLDQPEPGRPSWPLSSAPQDQRTASPRRPRVCTPPPARRVTPVKGASKHPPSSHPPSRTSTGRNWSPPSGPLPSWPRSFHPQAHPDASLFTASSGGAGGDRRRRREPGRGRLVHPGAVSIPHALSPRPTRPSAARASDDLPAAIATTFAIRHTPGGAIVHRSVPKLIQRVASQAYTRPSARSASECAPPAATRRRDRGRGQPPERLVPAHRTGPELARVLSPTLTVPSRGSRAWAVPAATARASITASTGGIGPSRPQPFPSCLRPRTPRPPRRVEGHGESTAGRYAPDRRGDRGRASPEPGPQPSRNDRALRSR